MTGIFPDPSSGGIVYRDGDGNCLSPSGVLNAYCPSADFITTCQITALPSDCTARFSPAQINAIVSELICLAEAWSPEGTWNCGNFCNLAQSFSDWQVNAAGALISADEPNVLTVGSDGGLLVSPSSIQNLAGYLYGMHLTNAVADTEHDITVSAGAAASIGSTPQLMAMIVPMTKRFDASFAEGNNQGGMVAGETLPVSGTIHVWVIMKADGTVDVCANNHASSGLIPVLPPGFTYSRRIASLRTDASANIRNFVQAGDRFQYKTWVIDLSSVASTNAVAARSLSVPAGIKVLALFSFTAASAGGDLYHAVYDPDLGSIVSSGSFLNVASVQNKLVYVPMEVMTNTSGQVHTTSQGSCTINCVTIGYVDTRGRFG